MARASLQYKIQEIIDYFNTLYDETDTLIDLRGLEDTVSADTLAAMNLEKNLRLFELAYDLYKEDERTYGE